MTDPRHSRTSFAEGLRNPGWLCFVWFGVTAGISLLEAPVKFTAPSLTREVALDVGRVVFSALNKFEIVAMLLLLLLVRLGGKGRDWWIASAVLLVILIGQTGWLLPELSGRAQQIVAGTEPGPSIAHGAYVTLEFIKLCTLAFLGFRAYRPVRWPESDTPS